MAGNSLTDLKSLSSNTSTTFVRPSMTETTYPSVSASNPSVFVRNT